MKIIGYIFATPFIALGCLFAYAAVFGPLINETPEQHAQQVMQNIKRKCQQHFGYYGTDAVARCELDALVARIQANHVTKMRDVMRD